MGHLCICVPSWSPIIQHKAAFPKIEAVCSYVTDKALSCSPSSCCPHRSLAWNDVLFCLFSAVCFQTTSFFLYLKKKICQSCFLSTWSCCYCFHWVGFLLFMISETRRWNETQSIFSTSLISISGMHLVELRFWMAVVFTGMSGWVGFLLMNLCKQPTEWHSQRQDLSKTASLESAEDGFACTHIYPKKIWQQRQLWFNHPAESIT